MNILKNGFDKKYKLKDLLSKKGWDYKECTVAEQDTDMVQVIDQLPDQHLRAAPGCSFLEWSQSCNYHLPYSKSCSALRIEANTVKYKEKRRKKNLLLLYEEPFPCA